MTDRKDAPKPISPAPTGRLAQVDRWPPGDGNHALRVTVDLAAKRARQEGDAA